MVNRQELTAARLFLVSLCLVCAVPSVAMEQKPAPAAKRISIHLKNASLADAIRELSAATGLVVFADAYRNDIPAAALDIDAANLEEAAAGIGQLFQRTAFVVGKIVVFRSPIWYMRLSQEQFMGPNWLPWPANSRAAATTSKQAPPAGGAARKPPVRLLDVSINSSSAAAAASAIARESGWSVAISPDISARRLSGYASAATPAQVLEAMTIALNGGQRVTIGQTKALQDEEAALIADYLDQRSEDQKASDALLEKLLGALSPAQRRAFERGEEVSLGLDSLPGALRQQASGFVDIAARHRAGGFVLDRSKAGGIRLVLPANGNTAIGVDARLTNGTPIHF